MLVSTYTFKKIPNQLILKKNEFILISKLILNQKIDS